VALRFESRGEERLKNIAEPVPVFRVVMDESTFGKRAGLPGRGYGNSASAVALFVAVLALVIIGGAVGWWRPWEPKYEPASLAKMALAAARQAVDRRPSVHQHERRSEARLLRGRNH
jgi:adenylate cyclase